MADPAPAAANAAAAAAAEAATISADRIGLSFVRAFYETLNTDPAQVRAFYGADSVLCRVGEGDEFTNELNVMGQEAIHEAITAGEYGGCKVKIVFMESQYSINRSLLVIVHGHLWNRGWKTAKNFVQSFVLAPIGHASYYVRNDILRYTGDFALPGAAEDEVVPPKAAAAAAAKAAEEAAAKAAAAEAQQKAADAAAKAAAQAEAEAAAAAKAAAELQQAKEAEKKQAEEAAAAKAAADAAAKAAAKAEAENDGEPAAAAAAAAKGPTKGPMRKEDKAAAAAAKGPKGPKKQQAAKAKAAENASGTENASEPAPAATAAARSWATRLFPGGAGSAPAAAAPAKKPAAKKQPAAAEKQEDEAAPAKTASPEPAAAAAAAAPTPAAAPAKKKKEERAPRAGGRPTVSAQAAERQLFVSGYAEETSEEELKEFFSAHGRVVEVLTIPGKPFCFLRFDSPAGVTAALEAQPVTLEGRELKVDRRRAEGRPRASGRGQRGGRTNRARRSVSEEVDAADGEGSFKTVRGRGKRSVGGARRGRGGGSTGGASTRGRK